MLPLASHCGPRARLSTRSTGLLCALAACSQLRTVWSTLGWWTASRSGAPMAGSLRWRQSSPTQVWRDTWRGARHQPICSMCCPLMWHLPRFVWLIRHALSRDPSLSFAFQSL